ncbi:MAG: N-acetyltransferase family protein [Chitinophagaceae bacterium]
MHTSQQPTIREANENDFPAIHSLILEFAAFQKSSEKVSVTVEQMKKDKGLFRCLVAETAEKEIIGFASYFFAYYSWSGKAVYLDDLYVTQTHRKKGVGAALLNGIIDIGRKNNCIKVRWQVSNWNKNGIDFYKRMGAEIDEVEINCDFVL